jgi:hypothetical protein
MKSISDIIRSLSTFGRREPRVRELPEAPPWQRVLGHCDCTPTTCICWEREQELRRESMKDN